MTDDCSSLDNDDCAKVIADLAVYLDGELSDQEQSDLMREHLGDCPPCKDKADLEECVRVLLRSRCAEQAPPDLVSKLQAKLAEWSA